MGNCKCRTLTHLTPQPLLSGVQKHIFQVNMQHCTGKKPWRNTKSISNNIMFVHSWINIFTPEAQIKMYSLEFKKFVRADGESRLVVPFLPDPSHFHFTSCPLSSYTIQMKAKRPKINYKKMIYRDRQTDQPTPGRGILREADLY